MPTASSFWMGAASVQWERMRNCCKTAVFTKRSTIPNRKGVKPMAAGGNNAGRGRDYRKPKDVQRTLRRLGRYLWNYPSLLFLVLAATISQSILGLTSSYLLNHRRLHRSQHRERRAGLVAAPSYAGPAGRALSVDTGCLLWTIRSFDDPFRAVHQPSSCKPV